MPSEASPCLLGVGPDRGPVGLMLWASLGFRALVLDKRSPGPRPPSAFSVCDGFLAERQPHLQYQQPRLSLTAHLLCSRHSLSTVPERRTHAVIGNSYNPILQPWKLRHEVATRLTSDPMSVQGTELEFDSMSSPKAFFYFYFLFWPYQAACRILVP